MIQRLNCSTYSWEIKGRPPAHLNRVNRMARGRSRKINGISVPELSLATSKRVFFPGFERNLLAIQLVRTSRLRPAGAGNDS